MALAWKLGISMSALVLLAAPFAVLLYPDYPAAWLVGLLSALAVRPLLEAALVVPLSELRAALSFRRIAMVDGIVQFAATCVTLVGAAFGAGAAALVLPQIAGVAARARIYGAETRHKSRIRSSASRQRILLSAFLPAALAQYSHNVLVMLEVLVLGFVGGGSQTGLFSLAYTLAAQANSVIAFQLGQVLQPIFGHLQDDRRRQVVGFIRVQRALAAICVPVAVAQAVVAEPLFRLLFPTDWQGAVSSFQVLSLAQAVYFCSGPTMSCLRAQHRFSFLFWWQTIQLLLCLPWYWLGASAGGAVGIAIASGCAWALSMVVGMHAVVHGIEARPLRTVLAVLAQPWIVCLPALAAGLFLTAKLSRFGIAGDVFAVAVAVPVLMVVMFACMRLLNRDIDHAFRKVKDAAIRRF
jgi:O-antigen/teichoic acid export membrane protein